MFCWLVGILNAPPLLIQELKPVLFTALLLLVAGAVVFAAKDS